MDEGLNDGLRENLMDGRLLGLVEIRAEEVFNDGLAESLMDGRLLSFVTTKTIEGLDVIRLNGRVLGLLLEYEGRTDVFKYVKLEGRLLGFSVG